MDRRILIAGIGNIFFGDDAFGCEAIRQLSAKELPEGVTATDFGIRSYDLAYAITSGFDTVILVDAVSRGEAPGTVYLIEPELAQDEMFAAADVNGHGMNPATVLQLASSLGGILPNIMLVGCEPLSLEPIPSDEAAIDGAQSSCALSPPVQNAVPVAIETIMKVVEKVLLKPVTNNYSFTEPASRAHSALHAEEKGDMLL